MGITSNLAASRLIQPGVIGSASERPAAPYEGQCIYQKDTNQLLVWDGSAWVIPNQTTTNPEGLELVKTQTYTSATTWDMKQCFSSTYNFYRMTIEFTVASGTLLLQLINGTTPTVVNSGNYYSAGFKVAYNGSLQTANDSGATSYSVSSSSINENAMFVIDFHYNPSATSMWTSLGTVVANAETFHKSGGYHAVVSHDGFRLSSSANMAGTIRVYGYRNS